MDDKVVDLKRERYVPPVSDFWFGHVDHRLHQIELMVRRLELQIWLIFGGACALLVMEIVEIFRA